jgi:hypothetical protein
MYPGGTIIDLDAPEWQGQRVCPPLNSPALDNEAADELLRLYPHCEPSIQLAPGVTGFELLVIRSGRAVARDRNDSDALLREVEATLREERERQERWRRAGG